MNADWNEDSWLESTLICVNLRRGLLPMSIPRIQFENVVQRFRVIRERPDTLREVFAKLFRGHSSHFYDFMALKEVSFRADEGEWLGVIGRNGSGKSTLLKVI